MKLRWHKTNKRWALHSQSALEAADRRLIGGAIAASVTLLQGLLRTTYAY